MPIGPATEFRKRPAGALDDTKKSLKRAATLLAWRLFSRWHFSTHDWIDTVYTNRGDIAIRLAVEHLLDEVTADEEDPLYVDWGALTPERVEEINRTCTRFVIGGGGYIFLRPDGTLGNRRLNDVKLLEAIRCPRIAFGIGLNALAESNGRRFDPMTTLPAATAAQLRRFTAACELVGVRDLYCAELLRGLSDKPVHFIGDPALFLPLPPLAPRRSSDRPLRIGINIAFHGPTSAAQFRQRLPLLSELLRGIAERHDARFVYFVHCDTEHLARRLLDLEGIPTRVVIGPPMALLAAYREVDFVICQMLHSAILASAAGTPSFNVAYDLKNVAFYDLMGMPECCMESDEADAATLTARFEALFAQRDVYAAQIERRRTELRRAMDQFVALVGRAPARYRSSSTATLSR